MFRSVVFTFLLFLGCPLGQLAAQTYAISTVIAAPGDGGVAHVDGPVANARVKIAGMTVDAAGNLYFTDQSKTVRRLSTAGIVSTLAGSPGQEGSVDGTGSAARFGWLAGIAVDAENNLYVVDSFFSTIRKITPGGVVSTLAGLAGSRGTVDGTGSAARFDSPTGIAVDAAGNLYISQAFAVRKVSPAGVVTTLARSSLALGEAATSADQPFTYLSGIALDTARNAYVTDSSNSVIYRISVTGAVSLVAGQRGQRSHADGGEGAARFSYPTGIASVPTDFLLISDVGTHTLRLVSTSGTTTLTLAGQVEQQGPIDGLGGAARFLSPTAVVRDSFGVLYIADSHGSALRKAVLESSPGLPILHTIPAMADAAYQNVGAGSAVTYTAAVRGAEISYQWSKNGVPIPGATLNTFTIPSASATDEGTYSITATNFVGSVSSPPVKLQVFTPALGALTARRTQPGGSFLWSIASGGGQLVTVGTGGAILTSSDGRTWTRRDSGTTDWLVGVTYGAGKFVAVGDRGMILVSTDGVSWTSVANTGTAQRLNNVVYARNTFVAVGENNAIVTSPDAQTWTLRSSPATGWLRGLAYNPAAAGRGLFAATGQGGTLLSSGDGVTWSKLPLQTTNDIEAVVSVSNYSNFTGIGQDGVVLTYTTYAMYPKSGGPPYYSEYWGISNTRLPGRLRGIASGANAIFATGENGMVLGGQSANGPWSVIPTGTTANLVGGIFHGNSLFVVGENETILQSEPLYNSRLINISTRANVGTNAGVMISGFVVSGTADKRVLLRAAGPSLAAFGLGGTLARPVLTLFDGAGRALLSNTGWGSASDPAAIAETTTRVGAFPFASGSADSALLVTLPPGSYTAQVYGVDGTTGLSLVEAYDADLLASEGSRAINISTRGQVGTDSARLIAGFVVNGAAARRVLIRGVGPSLAAFGLSGVLASPQVELYDARGNRMQAAAAWSTQGNVDELRGAAKLAGAFPLQEDSQDAVLVATLAPGSFTVQVSGVSGSTGLALVEVYDLP